jgi:hypothetical protein
MPSRRTLKKIGGSTSFGSANSKDLSPETRARRKRAKEYVNKNKQKLEPKKRTSNTSQTKKSSNPRDRAWAWAEKNLRKDKLETALAKGYYSKSEKNAVRKVLENPDLVRIIDGFNILEKRPYNSNDDEL